MESLTDIRLPWAERQIYPNVLLSEDYDINEVPKGRDGRYPLHINFSINVQSILAIDEPNQVRHIEPEKRVFRTPDFKR